MLDAEDGALFGRLALKGSTQHPLPGTGPGNANGNRRVIEVQSHRKYVDAEWDQKTTELSHVTLTFL